MLDFSKTWLQMLDDILQKGDLVAPRGRLTKEILQNTIAVNMRKPVLLAPYRRLSYKFMAAEAYWILSGDDRVETIAPYNSKISDFSDDGKYFFGAYGPKINSQLKYVLNKLTEDPSTRQAGLTTWRENPPHTKDVPCTIAMFFSLRHSKLNAHVFMRSSDAWLGVPYDVFNFSMLAHLVCGLLNQRTGTQYEPGTLYLTAASSHLYATDWEKAALCRASATLDQPETPEMLFQDPDALMSYLVAMKDLGARWWEVDHATNS
jgi:thymidylate synthase